MSNSIDRREALRQTAAGVASFFCIGRLSYAEELDDTSELHLAAAATFESLIQQWFIPAGKCPGRLQLPRGVADRLKTLSKLLTPATAPDVYGQAQVIAEPNATIVQFGPGISVTLDRETVQGLRDRLAKDNIYLGKTTSDDRIVAFYLKSFSLPENWTYDT